MVNQCVRAGYSIPRRRRDQYSHDAGGYLNIWSVTHNTHIRGDAHQSKTESGCDAYHMTSDLLLVSNKCAFRELCSR